MGEVSINVDVGFLHQVFRVVMIETISSTGFIKVAVIPSDDNFIQRDLTPEDFLNDFRVGVLRKLINLTHSLLSSTATLCFRIKLPPKKFPTIRISIQKAF